MPGEVRAWMRRVVALLSIGVAAAAGLLARGDRASATIASIDPPQGQNSNGHAAASVHVLESALSTCLRADRRAPGVTVSFSPACGSGEYVSRMNVTLPKDAATSFLVTEYVPDPQGDQVIQQVGWSVAAPAPTTSSTSSTSTTAPKATTTVTTTPAPTTTIAVATTAAPPSTAAPVTTRIAVAPRRSKSAPIGVLAPAAALVALGAVLLVRRQRGARAIEAATVPITASPATRATASTAATTSLAVPVAPASSAVAAGLAEPAGSVTLPWGRSMFLRAAGTRSARFRWEVEDVQIGQAGRWAVWPAHRPRGGLRTRRSAPVDAVAGEQALLLHPFIAEVGGIALVKLVVAVEVDGAPTGTFPAWVRFERTSDWAVVADVVHAPSSPEPEPAPPLSTTTAAGGDLSVPVIGRPPAPWSSGERVLLRAEADPATGTTAAHIVTWTASAGSFPAGAGDRAVVYEAPDRVGPVTITLTVTDDRGRATSQTVVVDVVPHTVVVVHDLLTDGLAGPQGRLWPPEGPDPLAALRSAGPDLPVGDNGVALEPVDRTERAARIRAVLAAAGHRVVAAPFDWRLDPAAAVAAQSLALDGTGPVTVIGHGYGGLVVREWLRTPGAAIVDDAVFVGTPHHGLPLAFRWLRFGGQFGLTHTSDLADAGDALASAAGREVIETWPSLYYLLPTPAWFAGVGPILDDRVRGAGWQPDASSTYLAGSGRLERADLVADARDWATANVSDGDGPRAHVVYATGTPTEGLFAFGSVRDIVGAVTADLHDARALTATDAAFATGPDGTPLTRSFSDADHSLVIALLDGDGVVPTASARGNLSDSTWTSEHRVEGVRHEELLDDTAVLVALVYLVEHLAPEPG